MEYWESLVLGKAWKMCDEMFEALKPWLPQF